MDFLMRAGRLLSSNASPYELLPGCRSWLKRAALTHIDRSVQCVLAREAALLGCTARCADHDPQPSPGAAAEGVLTGRHGSG
jgi:hypothetical protein